MRYLKQTQISDYNCIRLSDSSRQTPESFAHPHPHGEQHQAQHHIHDDHDRCVARPRAPPRKRAFPRLQGATSLSGPLALLAFLAGQGLQRRRRLLRLQRGFRKLRVSHAGARTRHAPQRPRELARDGGHRFLAQAFPGRGVARVADALQEPDHLRGAGSRVGGGEVGAAVVGREERERPGPVDGVVVPPVVLGGVVEAERSERERRLGVLADRVGMEVGDVVPVAPGRRGDTEEDVVHAAVSCACGAVALHLHRHTTRVSALIGARSCTLVRG